jgi:hypothetical protein
LLLAGHSKPEVIAAIKSAIEKKELPALEPGSVCYMMSKARISPITATTTAPT